MSAHFSIRPLQLCRLCPIHSRSQALTWALHPAGTISVPISNPFNPFTVADATLVINGVPVPVTTGVFFRGINDTGPRHEKFTYWDSLFSTLGSSGEMGEFGDYFKTWNWEAGFRYSRNEGQDLSIGDGKPDLDCGMRSWIRIRPRRLIRSSISRPTTPGRPDLEFMLPCKILANSSCH